MFESTIDFSESKNIVCADNDVVFAVEYRLRGHAHNVRG